MARLRLCRAFRKNTICVQTPGYVPALDPVSVQQLKLARTSYRTHEKKKYMKQFDAARQKAKAFSASVDPQRLQEIEADLGES